ncbi:MAG: NAD-dependent epimerase/dehydratase family protein [Paracoccaceae bacterium]
MIESGTADHRKRVLIVGASGRLGRMIQMGLDRIAPQDLDVRLLSRKAGKPWSTGAFCQWQTWSGNVRDTAEFRWADTVVNLAGLTPTVGANAPTPSALYAANVSLALDIVANSDAASRIMLASSASVYGPPKGGGAVVFSETDELFPVTDYARSKVKMELAVERLQDPRITSLRIGTVAGADQLLQNALKSTAEAPLKLDRFASGLGPLRSYIGPEGLTRAVLSLIRTPKQLPQLLNIAHPEPIRMELLLMALSAAGIPVSWEFREAAAGAIESVHLNTQQLARFHHVADKGDAARSIAQETADYLRKVAEKSL